MKSGIRDAVIVGSGAGGGPLALALSRAGLDVLVLEKGPRHRPEDYPADELANNRHRFFLPYLNGEPHTVVTPKTTRPVRTELGWIATCVGGGTVHMGAFLYRFHPDDEGRDLSRVGEQVLPQGGGRPARVPARPGRQGDRSHALPGRAGGAGEEGQIGRARACTCSSVLHSARQVMP